MATPYTTRTGLRIGQLYRADRRQQPSPEEALLQAALLNTNPKPPSPLRRLLRACWRWC